MADYEEMEKLGDRFYEVKRMVADSPLGKFCAYEVGGRNAFGKTLKEALENLLKLDEQK